MARYRVTVDTGGTFSDFVYLNEATGEISIAKVPSTPDDPSRAILAGIEALLAGSVTAAEIGYFCHGTTVGTNALLEGKGAATGLLVTEGFRGIYPVGEQARPYGPAIFDVMYDKPATLVPEQPHRRSEGARGFSRQCAAPARRVVAARHRARAQGAQHRVGRGMPVVFVSASRARSARARDRARGNAGLQRVALLRSAAADPRILSAEHDRHQRLSAADPGALCRAIWTVVSPARASRHGRNTSCSRMAAWRHSPRPRVAPSPPCCRGRPAASSRAGSPAASATSETSSPSTWAERPATSP